MNKLYFKIFLQRIGFRRLGPSDYDKAYDEWYWREDVDWHKIIRKYFPYLVRTYKMGPIT